MGMDGDGKETWSLGPSNFFFLASFHAFSYFGQRLRLLIVKRASFGDMGQLSTGRPPWSAPWWTSQLFFFLSFFFIHSHLRQ